MDLGPFNPQPQVRNHHCDLDLELADDIGSKFKRELGIRSFLRRLLRLTSIGRIARITPSSMVPVGVV